MKYPIHIDDEFRALVPPMSADSLVELERSVRVDGLRDHMLVWWDRSTDRWILVDGHHRHAILKKIRVESKSKSAHDDPDFYADNTSIYRQVGHDGYLSLYSDAPERKVRTGRDWTRDDVLLFILQNQIGRRNLSDDQQVAIWTEIAEQRAKVSRERAASVARDAKAGTVPHVSSATEKKDVRKDIEKESGGKATVWKQQSHREFKQAHPIAYKDVREGRKTLRQARKESAPRKARSSPDLSNINLEFLRTFMEQIRQAKSKRPVSQRKQVDTFFAREIIKHGRRVLAEKYHPDKGGSTDDMARVNAAEQLLTTLLNSFVNYQ